MKFISKHYNVLILGLIILLAALLRFWQLGDYPVSPNWDEVSHGYNAYSILKTGKDEWGVSFPTIFKAFGDYKLPVYIYLTVIPVSIFGLNVFAVRFISALAGTLAIFGIYLLTNYFWPDLKLKFGKINIKIGILTAYLLAINPWHFFISRPALEANLSLTLIIFGFYFLVKGLDRNKFLIPSSVLLGLSLHTYNTARVFVPLLGLATILIYYNKLRINKSSIISAVILIAFAGIVLHQLSTGEATARYNKLQILSDNAIYQIGDNYTKSKLPKIIAKAIYNRPVYFVKTAALNYLNYFSPQFFYQSQGAQTQFAIPIKNLFTLSVTAMSFVGLVYLFINRKSQSNKFIFTWLLASPVAASLTADPPQALRPNPMIPALLIIACLGVFLITTKVKGFIKNLVLIVFILSASFSFYKYINSYFYDYSKNYADSWQYGYKEVIDYINQNENNYDKIFITKAYAEPHIFYAFFSKLNPTLLQPGSNSIRFEKSNWFWTDKIGKVYFINEWNIPTSTDAKTLKLESGEEVSTSNSLLITTLFRIPKNAKMIKAINYPLDYSAFIITSIK